MWRSEDNFYGVVGSGTKLGSSGFPKFLTTETSHFFQILSFLFFEMFVVGIYICASANGYVCKCICMKWPEVTFPPYFVR